MNGQSEGFRSKGRRAGWARLAVVVPILCGMLTAAPARAADPNLRIKYATDPKGKWRNLVNDYNISLRPNVEQAVSFRVYYPGTETKKRNVVVELVVDGKVEKPVRLTLNPGDDTPVSFGKPKQPIAFKPCKSFEVRLLDTTAANRRLLQKVVAGRILQAFQYLTASSRYDSQAKRLQVVVTARDGFTGPPCDVELVLPKAELPENIGKRFNATLKKAGDEVKLEADNLEFKLNNTPRSIYLTVDGYTRAFIFRHKFRQAAGPDIGTIDSKPSVRILNAEPEFVAGMPYNFGIAVDYSPQGKAQAQPGEVQLELGLYKDENDLKKSEFQPRILGPGVKKQELQYSLDGDQGAIILKPVITDWVAKPFKTKGYQGPYWLVVRLLDKDGKPIADIKESKKKITFFAKERSPVVFVDPPKKAQMGEEVTFKVKPRNPEFKITEGKIFVGEKPLPDSPKLVESDEKGVWIAKLTMPNMPKVAVKMLAKGRYGDGPVKNGEGEANLTLKKPRPTGKLKVTVDFLGTPVANFKVTLIQTGKLKKKVKEVGMTDKDGVLRFKGLEPGEYIVEVENKLGNIRGKSEPVTVEANDTAEAKVTATR
jgi:hypothetical protein